MLLVVVPLEIFITIIILMLLMFIGIFLVSRKNKNKKLFISQIVHLLMKEKMQNVKHFNKKYLYNISFRYNERDYFIKLYKGGRKKGFIMTNPSTIYATTYSSQYGPAKSSERATKLVPFLIEPLKGTKIILVKDNMLRITKYINENEIEEVKYNVPAFNTYIVQEKDLSNFIGLIKNLKKK